MSFLSALGLVSGKRPIWLYRITRGFEQQLFTSRKAEYVDEREDFFSVADFFAADDFYTQTWLGFNVTPSRILNTASIGRSETTLSFPRSVTWARDFVNDNGYEENTVEIFQLFLNDADVEKRRRFIGRVVGTTPSITRTKLTCENKLTEGRRKALSAVIQRPCRHDVYINHDGIGCGASFEVMAEDLDIESMTDGVITIPGADAFDDGYFAGGVLLWNNKYSYVTSHVGTAISVLLVPTGLQSALALEPQPSRLAPGCDGTRSTCFNTFNSLADHGGFPWADDAPYDGDTLY